MWILVSAVFTASLMGSLHCVGMCGPLALWASGADQRVSTGRMIAPTFLYHFGRLITYSLVGLIAGAIGQVLDWGGDSLGVQLLAARVVGVAMIIVGVLAVWRITRPWWNARWMNYWAKQKLSGEGHSVQPPTAGKYVPPKPNWITSQLIRLRPRLFGVPLPARALIVGLLTALLPCGWLYLFALLATGTGSAASGAVLMAAFWLGSVPALVGLVASARLLTTPVRRFVPLAASLLLIVAGAYTVSGRGMAELNGQWKVSSSLVDKLQSGQPVDGLNASDIQSGLEQLVSTPLPCCQDKAKEVSSSAIEGEASR